MRQSPKKTKIDQLTEQCETMAKIFEATAWAAEQDQVYQNIVDTVVEVLHCDNAHLHLITSDGSHFVRRSRFAEKPSESHWSKTVSLATGRMQRLAKTHLPIIMDCDNPSPEDEIPPEALESGLKYAVSFPLLAGNNLIGMCSVVYRRKVERIDDDLYYFGIIGRILGVAIQRVQATKKMTDLKILDERRRLSAEIHDNLSQSVSALAIGVETVAAAYEKGDDAAFRSTMKRVSEISQDVMRMLRSEAISLRMSLEQADGFVSGIEECLKTFTQYWGIETHFDLKVSDGPLMVPLDASLQLTRILNESLSNVLRHSEAGNVNVLIQDNQKCLSMFVEDDGKGFDLQAVPPESLGLKIMHERAETAGGRLTIVSGADGTTICVDINKTW